MRVIRWGRRTCRRLGAGLVWHATKLLLRLDMTTVCRVVYASVDLAPRPIALGDPSSQDTQPVPLLAGVPLPGLSQTPPFSPDVSPAPSTTNQYGIRAYAQRIGMPMVPDEGSVHMIKTNLARALALIATTEENHQAFDAVVQSDLGLILAETVLYLAPGVDAGLRALVEAVTSEEEECAG